MPPGGVLEFRRSLGCLAEPALERLAARLRSVRGLAAAERAAVCDGAASALYQAVHVRVSRVLLLELNAARVAGRLTAADSAGRWAEFAEASAQPQFWESLARYYPTLLSRLRALIDHRCAAALTMAQRLAADRAALVPLLGAGPGELAEVTFGTGDSHRGGQSVAVLRFTVGLVVYKPRPVQVDAALAGMLAAVLSEVPPQVRIRVPDVVPRGEYGWAQYVAHKYCTDAGQLASFYRGIGHWLAIMRLLSGSDLHAENMIACGPVPVVVDCETLFTPQPPPEPSGFGLAVDRASAIVGASVLRTGLLPRRGVALGWRGVDSSAAGFLPGQQPPTRVMVIENAGSDLARVGFALNQSGAGAKASHPSPEPAPAAYWDRVMAGFTEVTGILKAMDQSGALEPLLDRFTGGPVRVVLRPTETYAELGRMLWHPVSLHNQAAAVSRATEVLAGMARQYPHVPGDPQIIAAEIADLLTGDIPFFTTTPRDGRLTGPGGTTWLPGQDLAAAALEQWRRADPGLEQQVMQATLASAYLNDDQLPARRQLPPGRADRQNLDQRRRTLAARVLTQLRDSAIHGDDGTVTWIAPVLHPTGWAVQPLSLDTYAGLAGAALLLAGYLREAAAGRADEVSGIPDLLTATLHTIRTTEDELARPAAPGIQPRPPLPGAYIGLGSRIWAWLILHRLGAAGPDGLDRARALARELPAAVAASEEPELLAGTAGAIIPLLHLAEATGENHWLDQATAVGDRLIEAARCKDGTAYWPSPRWPEGLGGLSHGVTGIGWSLARLALATRQPRFADLAAAAFAFDDTLYDPAAGGWLDLRQARPGTTAAWCHGAVGIGLAAADLTKRGWPTQPGLLPRAAAAAHRSGPGWNHTLCHGDLGRWELLHTTSAGHPARHGQDHSSLTAQIISSIEHHDPVTGHASNTFGPGLLAGTGGIAYQLLRTHPDSDLPSLLTLEA